MVQPNSTLTNMKVFRATYRLQLRKEFTFADAAEICRYFDELGVSHLYLSPVLESRAGSSHGYDTIDPTKLSEERGGESGFKVLAASVDRCESLEGLILDIVPNHVAADDSNPYWWDILKQGPKSNYWTYFDIRPRRLKDFRIVLPVLGRSREAVVTAGELKLEKWRDEYVFRYWQRRFPLRMESQDKVATAFRSGRLQSETLPLEFIFEILDEQFYVLEAWQKGSKEINYRRFFDINDLAAIRVEEPEVFEWSHSKVESLIKKYPIVHGLRVDHIDGLTDPEAYLQSLRRISKHVWVEKILGDGEQIPKAWETLGSTGYEFSNITARVFVDLAGLLLLHSHYIKHIDTRWSRFHDCVYQSKRQILESHFVSEIRYLARLFYKIASEDVRQDEFTKDELYEALMELTCSLKVYRTYRSSKGEFQSQWLNEAFMEVEGRGKLFSLTALNWLRDLILADKISPEAYSAIKKWEQLSGPVMAKGLEDTALYRYFPLLSLNVVGGEPDWAGDGVIEFHAYNQERLRHQPLGLSTTSTHDTKRSEDVRSRIHVLSDMAEEWISQFEAWTRLNGTASDRESKAVVNLHTEYFIYETLVGVWPLDSEISNEFVKRLQAFFIKAAREAKSQTSWTEPNPAYEDELTNYVAQLLLPQNEVNRKLLAEISELAQRCAYFGAFNSLSLLTLKVLSPGVPDFYQGCELWDLSLVDPDNRRPVDYKRRYDLLKRLKSELKADRPSVLKKLRENWSSGEIKFWLTYELLQIKRANAELVAFGDYIPIEINGDAAKHFICFMRHYDRQWLLAVVPKLLVTKTTFQKDELKIDNTDLLSHTITFPKAAPSRWQSPLTQTALTTTNGGQQINALLSGMPVGVWLAVQTDENV